MPSRPSPAPAPVSDSTSRHKPSSPLVIVSVAIICIVFLVFSYYKVLKRLCCAFIAVLFSRNQVQSQLLDDSNFDNNPPSQNQSNALESTVTHNLPISQFTKENKEPPRLSNTDCAVCLGDFEEGEWIRYLPNCTHAFHRSCIDIWFQSHSSCPLCRSSVSDLTIPPGCSVSMFTI